MPKNINEATPQLGIASNHHPYYVSMFAIMNRVDFGFNGFKLGQIATRRQKQ